MRRFSSESAGLTFHLAHVKNRHNVIIKRGRTEQHVEQAKTVKPTHCPHNIVNVLKWIKGSHATHQRVAYR